MRRDNLEALLASGRDWDTVIHCAHPRAKDVEDNELAAYLGDGVDLTTALLARCRRRFVLMSSISVYPSVGHSGDESIPIRVDALSGLYGWSKLMCEARARRWAEQPERRCTILRLASMLGLDSPNNVTHRILRGEVDAVPLTAASMFNFVTHAEVELVVLAALQGRAEGTLNVGAGALTTLDSLARFGPRPIRFGDIFYSAPLVPIERAAHWAPSLRRSSEGRLQEIARRLRANPVNT